MCVHRADDDADLVVGKLYRVRRSEREDRASDIRVIDESGENYLYPRAWFVPVTLPVKARKVLTASI